MKKRFLDRFTYPYLQKRLPENIVPGRGLSAKRAKSLHKGKPFRPSIAGLPPVGGKTPNRSPGLCLRLMKGTLRLHKRKLFGEKRTWSEIDALERGSWGSAGCPPSPSALGGSLLSPTKVWVKGLPDGRSLWPHSKALPRKGPLPGARAPELRGGAPTPQLGRATLSKEGRDSIHPFFQLEQALTKQQERRPSALLLKLMERNKLRIMYGNLANREVDRLIERGLSTRGVLSDNLFRLLESRIDVFLCRIGFFATIPNARQWIHHGKILINRKIVTTASHMLKPGDVVSISASNITPLRESLEERSGGLQILKGQQSSAWGSLTTRAEQGLRGGSLATPGQRGGSMTIRGEHGWREGPTSNVPQLKTIGKGKKAELIGGAGRAAPQVSEGGRGAQFPPNFAKLVRGPRTMSDRPARSANDARRERLRWFNAKPTNAEISFRCLTAIYLYTPQQLILPATIDVERIRRS